MTGVKPEGDGSMVNPIFERAKDGPHEILRQEDGPESDV
jgi:hypothetical protein